MQYLHAPAEVEVRLRAQPMALERGHIVRLCSLLLR